MPPTSGKNETSRFGVDVAAGDARIDRLAGEEEQEHER
jgi:hypothetical protein